MGVHLDGSRGVGVSRLEVIESPSGRRRRTMAERALIAVESMMPGVKVADVERKHGATRWQISDWRKQIRAGNLMLPESAAALPIFAELVVKETATAAPAARGAGGSIKMLGQGAPAKVFVATRPVDFRKGIDSLALAVQEVFGIDPFCGAVFVFRSKRADRIKLLVWDQTGMLLVHKRLEGGKFVWPQVRDEMMRMSSAKMAARFEGLDWRLVRPERARRPLAAG